MATLTTKARSNLPTKDFAEPGKRGYPIEDTGHAKAALSRVSEYGSPAEKSEVRSATHSAAAAVRSDYSCTVSDPVGRDSIMGNPAVAGDGGSPRPTVALVRNAGEYALVIVLIAFLVAVMAYYGIR